MNRLVSGITWGVAVLLAVSALSNCIMVLRNSFLEKDLNNVMAKARAVQNTQGAVQNLAADLTNYGRKQPDIFIILKKYGINPPPDMMKKNGGK